MSKPLTLPALRALLRERLSCWWHGHQIVATIMPVNGSLGYVFHCARCSKPLPGPEK